LHETVLENLKDCILNFRLDATPNAVRDALDRGVSIRDVIDVLRKGLQVVGEKYEAGEYFLSELVMAGEVMKAAMSVLQSRMEERDITYLGTVVVGTVEGDIHDIGKNIFGMLSTGAGFKVIDVGVDVGANKFVEALKTSGAGVLGISALLNVTAMNIPRVTAALRTVGLRNSVKVILGGATMTDDLAKRVGGDAYAADAVQGVEICKSWTSHSVPIASPK
jgi:methanogenic corrinoid protein MtbC1